MSAGQTIRDVAGDFRLAIRSLRAAPSVTLASVLTLALGIGTTTAIFSVANGLILRPLPVKDPQNLVTITSDTALRFGFHAGIGWSYAMWDRFQRRADAFDGAFAWTIQRLDLSEGGEMQPVDALVASGAFFRTLGVHAVVGRTFEAADDVPGGGPSGGVVVISHDLWQRRFNGAAGAVGTRLLVEGTPLTIVGVAPKGFRGVDVGQPFDIAMPFGTEPLIRGRRSLLDNQQALVLAVMLRLKTGQTIPGATSVLRAMQPQILGANVPQLLEEPFTLVPASTGLSDRLRQQYERPLVTLSIVSGLVLTIVCVNVANLLLARAIARRRELSVRLALGATRWRLARQRFIEALVLGGAGALGGILFAALSSRALVAQLPAAAGPLVIDLPIDWRVLAFTVGTTMVAVVLFGTGPALYATRVPPIEALQDEGRVAGAGRSGRLTSGLIVAQVAISIVLLAGAGLFIRTLNRLASVPLGFDPKGVLVVTVSPPRSLTEPSARILLNQRLVESMAAVPGVTRAAGSVWTPIGSGGGGVLADAGGRRADVGRQVAFNFVTPGWFATYGTPIHAGRDVEARDSANAPRVALVNEAFRRARPQDRLAIGDTVEAGPCGRGGCTVIIGVVADAVYGRSLRDAPPPTVYRPLAQSAGLGPPDAPFRISVRAAGSLADLTPSLDAALRRLDPGLAYTFRPLEADVDAAVIQERLVAILAAFFGAIALVLSAIGLYGVTSYAVTRRRGEIGIRLALGGLPVAVVKLLLQRIAWLVLAGTAVGLLIAVWLSRFVAPLLYGLEPGDPATLAAATVTLVSVAALAGWIPASRAARMDPAQVLREH